jgi:hypothetical protein
MSLRGERGPLGGRESEGESRKNKTCFNLVVVERRRRRRCWW